MQVNCRIASAPQTKSLKKTKQTNLPPPKKNPTPDENHWRTKGNSEACRRSYQLSGQPTYNKVVYIVL